MNSIFNFSKPQSNSTKRELLFTFQSIIVTGLLAFTAIAFFFHNNLAIEKGIKVIFAPFLSVVPLLFILSILRDLHQGFRDGNYTKQCCACTPVFHRVTFWPGSDLLFPGRAICCDVATDCLCRGNHGDVPVCHYDAQPGLSHA